MSDPLLLGFEEWLALPGLGLPAIRAKVDTGAQTSALSAHLIERTGSPKAPSVRFIVHPVPGRPDIEIVCETALIGERRVTSSNGLREARFVIGTDVEMGGRRWPVEITLTARDRLTTRMLLGRQGIPAGARVDANATFLQPRLGAGAYETPRRPPAQVRPLRIALLTADGTDPGLAHIAAAIAAAGHVPGIIVLNDAAAQAGPGGVVLTLRGAPLPAADAVVCLVRAPADATSPAVISPAGRAIQRSLEANAALVVNGAAASSLTRDALATAQVLAAARLSARLDAAANGHPPLPGPRLNVLVAGGRAVAMMEPAGAEARLSSTRVRKWTAERKLARRTCQVLGLALAEIEIAPGDDGTPPTVTAVRPTPKIEHYGADAARVFIAHVERTVLGRGGGGR